MSDFNAKKERITDNYFQRITEAYKRIAEESILVTERKLVVLIFLCVVVI